MSVLYIREHGERKRRFSMGAGVGREANRKVLFGKILKAQTALKVEVWNMGKK